MHDSHSLFHRAGAAFGRFAMLARPIVLILAAAAAVLFIAVLTLLVRQESTAAKLLLDYSAFSIFPYPFTIQNGMYLMFFLCAGDLCARWGVARRELAYCDMRFLPENPQAVIRLDELGDYRDKVQGHYNGEHGFLPKLIDLCVLQLQTGKSIQQAVTVLNADLELINHRVDLRYSFIRYIIWAIPTVGFIGTVIGISRALSLIDPGEMDIAAVTGGLGIAFYTTIIALFLSAILVFLQHLIQKREELAVNYAGDYCLNNLINRIHLDVS